MEPKELENRAALVLGGANGAGKACVELFARRGARVVFADVDGAAGEQLAAQLMAAGYPVQFFPCDAGDVEATQAFVHRGCEAVGPPHVAMYATGIIKPCGFLDLRPQDYEQVMSVNLRGAVFFFQAAARAMIDAGVAGSLVSISSVGGVVAGDNTHAYGMSKAGLIHLAKSMAVSLAPYGIRANSVGPGGINTAMQHKLSVDERRASLSRTPLLRLAEPQEIAQVALFLASDASSYVTGHTIIADGGRLALHRTVKVPPEPA
jgi:glucose 1-dehydrogenase